MQKRINHSMIPVYLYCIYQALHPFTMYYQNPNPTDIRSSSHAHVMFFLQLSFSLCTLSCMRVCCCFSNYYFFFCTLSFSRSSFFPLQPGANMWSTKNQVFIQHLFVVVDIFSEMYILMDYVKNIKEQPSRLFFEKVSDTKWIYIATI
jgi:hypothetical protein